MSEKEFNLFIDLMLALLESGNEKELIAILHRFREQDIKYSKRI